MTDPNWSDPTAAKIAASFMGALVSLRFIVGTWPERLLMFVGGAALSYYSTEPVALWVSGITQAGAAQMLLRYRLGITATQAREAMA